MTKMSTAFFPNRPCEICGAVEDCLPYRPNQEWVCLDCGLKEAAKMGFCEGEDEE
jgi:hypothetical protein